MWSCAHAFLTNSDEFSFPVIHRKSLHFNDLLNKFQIFLLGWRYLPACVNFVCNNISLHESQLSQKAAIISPAAIIISNLIYTLIL